MGQVPGLADMLDERLGLVLNEQIDGVNPGVYQVAEHEIHDSVAGAGRARFNFLCSKEIRHHHEK